MISELPLLSIGVVSIVIGFAIPISTFNFFGYSKKVQQRFELLKTKQRDGEKLEKNERDELTYFEINDFLYKAWKYFVSFGALLIIISFI